MIARHPVHIAVGFKKCIEEVTSESGSIVKLPLLFEIITLREILIQQN
jgi:hypothetical protein